MEGRDAGSPRWKRYLRRWAVGSVVATLAASVLTASSIGVAFGPGESFPGKVVDGVAAVPRVFRDFAFYWGVLTHPVRTARVARESYEKLQYAREHLPGPDEIEEGLLVIDRNTMRLDRGSALIREGLDSILRWESVRPFDGSLPVSTSINTMRAGARILPAPDSFAAAVRRGSELAGAARAVLASLPYEETYERVLVAIARLEDNFAPDERIQTVFLMALLLAGAVVSPAATAYWIRRGRPGLLAAFVMRRGMEHWPDEYVEEVRSWPIYERLKEEILAEGESREGPGDEQGPREEPGVGPEGAQQI